MSKYSNTVEYNIRTTLDNSGVAKLQSELTQLQNQINALGARGLMGPQAVNKTLGDVAKVKAALTEAFNPKLGMLNMSQFMSNLKNQGMSLRSIYNSFSQAGMAGQRAFMSMYGQISKIDTGLKSMSKTTDKIINTFGNTFRWGVIASGFAAIMNSVHQAAQYTKELDESLTNIMMVSGISRDNMNEYARAANQVAKQLGSTTVAMTNATQVFVQQGYDLPTSQRLAQYSTVLGNVSQQDTATASDELTAYMNAFKIPLDQIGNALSKWAEVANVSAADVEELSVASQKAASVAATVGVDMDQLAATIATIETVTREAPENIGNGLKTIYSRLSDIKLGKTLDDGVNLGQITKQLDKVGVQVLDQQGQMREVGSIVEDLMAKWKDMSMTERAATATTLAGRFQLARFEALMNRSDLYESYLKSSRDQVGTQTLDFMQETFEDSLQGRLNTLQATVEETFLEIFDSSSFYGAVDALTKLVEVLNDVIKATGGGSNALLGIAAILTKLASNSLARGASNFITNRMADFQGSRNVRTIEQASLEQIRQGGLQTTDQGFNELGAAVTNINLHAGDLNETEQQEITEKINNGIEAYKQYNATAENTIATQEHIRVAMSAAGIAVKQNTEEMIAQSIEAEQDGVKIEFLSEEVEGLRHWITDVAESFTVFSEALNLSGKVNVSDLETYIEFLQDLVNKGVIAAENCNLVTEAIDKMKIALNQAEAEGKEEIVVTEEFKGTMQQTSTVMMDFAKHLGQDVPRNATAAREDMERLQEELVNTGNAAETSRKELEGIGDKLDLRSKIKGVIDFGNTLMSLTFVFQSFKNLSETLEDSSLSPLEKFEQLMINIGMALTMGGPLISQAADGIKKLTVAGQAYIATNKGMYAADLTHLNLKKETIDKIAKQIGGRVALTAAEVKEIAVTNGVTTAAVKEIAAKNGVVTVNNKLIKTGKILQTLAVGLGNTLAPMLPVIAGVLLLGAAIGGTVATLKQMSDAYHEMDIAVEHAEENVSKANARLNEAKTGLENVKAAIDNIKNSDSVFRTLKQGTLEWTQALIEANNTIQDLIRKFPVLARYLTKGKYGQTILSEEGLEEAVRSANSQLASAAAQQANAQENLYIAKNNQASVNAARLNNFSAYSNNLETTGSAYNGIEDSGSNFKLEYNNANVAKDMQDLVQGYKDTLWSEELRRDFIRNNNLTTDQIKAMEELIVSIETNTTAIEAQNRAAAGLALSNSKAYQAADATAKTIMENTAAGNYAEGTANYNAIQERISKMSKEQQQQAYAEMMGYVTGSNGKYYTSVEARNSGDSSGLVDWNNIDVEGALIADSIAKGIEADADKIATPILLAYKNISSEVDEDFAKIFAGNGKLDFSKVQFGSLDDADLSKLTTADLRKMGFNSYDDFAKAFNEASALHPLTPQVDIRSKYDFDSDAEIDEYLKNNTDIERDVLDTATSLRMQNSGSKNNFNIQNEEAIEQAKKDRDMTREGSKERAEAEKLLDKAIKDTTKDEELYEKALQRAAAAEARQIKTIKQMNEHFDKNADILQTAEKGSIEYAEALQQTKEDLAGLLDIDAEQLSNDFVASAETLELMREAAEGNEEAFESLQKLATEDLISQIDIKTVLTNEDGTEFNTEYVQQTLRDLIAGLDAENLSIDAEANIDTEGFYDRVNELLEQGVITADQLTQILSTAGYVGEIDYKEAEGDYPATTYTVVVEGSQKIPVTAAGDDASSIVAPSVIKMVPQTEMVHGKTVIPVLKGATQKGGVTQAARAANRGSSGKGGGGGGGGSKGKTIKPTETKNAKVDPYQKVNAELEKLGDHYTEVDKAKGRMYGDKYRKAAQEEIKNLQDQNKKLEERIEISKKLLEAYQTGQDNPDYGIYLNGESLDKYGLTDTDFDGIIDNRWERIEQLYLDYQAKLNAANVLAGEDRSDAEQEEFNRLNEIAEKAYELWNGAQGFVGEYEDAWNKIRDDTQQIQDNMYEMEDIAIDLFQIATDTVDTLKDLNESKGWLQGFYTGDKSDSPFRAMVEDLSVFNGLLKTTTYEANSFFQSMIDNASDDTVRQFWEGVRDEAQSKIGDGTSILDMRQFYLEKLLSDEGRAIYGSNEKQYIEDLEKLYNDIIGDMKDIESLQEKIIDDIIDGYGKINEDIEFANEQWEYGIQLLEHQTEMAELLHGEDAYDMFGVIDQALVDATLEKADKARWEYDYWVEQRDKYDKETRKEIWEDLDKRAREFGEALQEATKEAADAMLKQYQDATENIIKNLRDELFGGTLGDGQFFEKEWEMANDQAEQYLDKVERGMELEKLRGRVQQIQDDVIDTAGQKYADRAKDILKTLEDQKKAIMNNQGELEYINALSQFDVDLANAKIEALQKQIALEEAQRNKNQMQLRRDTQGNYRYVYRANEDDILSAQEELADSEYEIYEMSKERYSDVLNERLQVQQEYEERLRFITERYKDDREKLQEALEKNYRWYVERQKNLGLELQDAQAGMIEGVKHLAEDTTDYVAQTFADIATAMEDNWAEALGDIGVIYDAELANLTEDTDGFIARIDQAQNDTIDAAEQFDKKLRDLEEAAKTSFTNITGNVDNITYGMEDLNAETEKFMGMIKGDTGEIDAATAKLESYRKEIESLKDSSSALASTLADTQQQLDNANRDKQVYKTNIENVAAGNGYFDENGEYHAYERKETSGASNASDRDTAWGIAQNIWTYGSWGNGQTRVDRITDRFGAAVADLTQQYLNEYINSGRMYELLNWDSDELYGYATGGYTGTWSKDDGSGRVALLHQKELVLNESDTENMLAAVDMVRQAVNMLKGSGGSSLSGVFNTLTGQPIEQRVAITAEFPNVDTADDIRQALLGLADNAFQYAYKTR